MEDYEECNYSDYDLNSDSSSDTTSDSEDSHCSSEDLTNSEHSYKGFEFLTKFEKTRILSVRTQQILSGGKIFVNPKSNDPFEIAQQELMEKKIPLLIRRYFHGKYHDISVNELKILQ
nr:MAG: DNA-directed RNA polymerase [Diabrotica toursvirus 3a]